jgi:uncharacterized protein YndB with AHSA1/START domain
LQLRSRDVAERKTMDDKFTAKATTTINAPASQVWIALTTPDMIKQYFFGVDVVSNWKEGSTIVYRGEWEGKSFEDKGKILKVKPEKELVTTHWSPLPGAPDSPENYHTVSYELQKRGGKTQVTITQDNNASEEEKKESEKNWKTMLDGMKRLLEE